MTSATLRVICGGPRAARRARDRSPACRGGCAAARLVALLGAQPRSQSASWCLNHVNCRFAYRRVSPCPGVIASSRSISPRRWAMRPGTPCARMAGSMGSRFRVASKRTSSSAPVSIMARKRRSMRCLSSSRSGDRNSLITRWSARGPGRRAPWNDARGRPVAATISSARWTRRRSDGRRREAVSGSRSVRSLCKAGVSRPSLSRRTCSRTSSGTAGMSDRPSVSALKYRPVPPTKIGRRSAPHTASADTASTV